MKNNFKKLGFSFIVLITFYSCINLKHVNGFSVSSLESITSFEELHYSFKQSCSDKCIARKINALKVNTKDCDCKLEKKADSITLKIYSVIYGYLNGLAKLSNNEITSYNTEDLKTTLIQGEFGPITIEEAHVASYSKISEILLRSFTDTYRKKKLKEYVKGANASVKELLFFLDFNLSSNLNGKLNVKKNRIKGTYFDFIKDPSYTAFDKRSLLISFYNQINVIENQQLKLKIYSKTLKKITAGHQKLYDNIDRLSAKEMKQTLFKYASEIDLILSEFKKIEA